MNEVRNAAPGTQEQLQEHKMARPHTDQWRPSAHQQLQSSRSAVPATAASRPRGSVGKVTIFLERKTPATSIDSTLDHGHLATEVEMY